MGVKDSLRAFIIEELQWTGEPAELTDDYELIENQVLDSLGLMEVAGYLERQHDVQVDDIDLVASNFSTLAAIDAFVAQKRPAGAAPRR